MTNDFSLSEVCCTGFYLNVLIIKNSLSDVKIVLTCLHFLISREAMSCFKKKKCYEEDIEIGDLNFFHFKHVHTDYRVTMEPVLRIKMLYLFEKKKFIVV